MKLTSVDIHDVEQGRIRTLILLWFLRPTFNRYQPMPLLTLPLTNCRVFLPIVCPTRLPHQPVFRSCDGIPIDLQLEDVKDLPSGEEGVDLKHITITDFCLE